MPRSVILVIDDEPHILDNLSDLLGLEGYQVKTASDGRDALEILIHTRPRLILCDMMMPHVDGWEVLQHVRADAELNEVPFIFLTASAEPNTRQKAFLHDADDYITKPFRVDDLLDTVADHLGNAV